MTPKIPILSLLLAALGLAACGGGSGDPAASGLAVTRGTITATSPGALTVNGVSLSTAGAAVRVDGKATPAESLRKGMVVTARGQFDDRTGRAAEIELRHAIEGRVDDKGTDFVVIGGQRVHVDDSTEFGEDNPARLASVQPGDVIAVSGVPDDRGGLRASRIDDSPRQGGASADDDDFDVHGFVSSVQAGSFQLRISPDATSYWLVTTVGVTLPAGFGNGASVEVHSLAPPVPGTPPLLGTIAASSIELEDRFDEGDAESEVEGIVTSGTAASFVVDGVTVMTDGATVWRLGLPGDLVPGAKVEAEGQVDASGVLHARKVSFRAGVRITAVIEGYDGASMTLLGVPVQIPSFVRVDPSLTLGNGVKVEVRGNPSADGGGVVALRIDPPSGNADRVFLRAVATAKSNANPAAPSFTVLGFNVTTAGAEFRGTGDEIIGASAFYAAVDPGRTVVKVRAASAADVTGGAFAAEELELEGDE